MQNESGIDFDAIMAGVADAVSTWGLRVVGALAVLIIGWMVAKVVRRSVRKALERSSLDNTLVPFISSLVYYALLIFVGVAVLSLFGIQTTSFIAVLGAAGFAVGLALQGTLSNFAAGVMLLIFRPFKVGDYIEAAGTAGTVQEIAVFSTTLHSPDNVRIILPNSSIYGQLVKNYSINETRRNDMVFGIDYSDDIGKAMETIRKILAADSRVLKDPEPIIAVGELADSSVNLLVRPWCSKDDYWDLRWDLTRTIKVELEAAGCSIPFPQTDVHLHNISEAGAA
jgi:small conductance mechanosensitive channel